jgi:hypothetical protein
MLSFNMAHQLTVVGKLFALALQRSTLCNIICDVVEYLDEASYSLFKFSPQSSQHFSGYDSQKTYVNNSWVLISIYSFTE